MSTVFTDLMSYSSPRRECYGYDSFIHQGYKKRWIQLLPYQEVATLYKQRFYLYPAPHTFSAKIYCVAENGYLSRTLKFASAADLKKTIPMKDSPQRYLVPLKRSRGADPFFKEPRLKPDYLPKHLLIDPFKGTKAC